PILCGGFHALLDDGKTPRDSAGFEALITAVRDAERELGGPTAYLAGVDLSHAGPRFGDAVVDDRTRADVEAIDREALEAARARKRWERGGPHLKGQQVYATMLDTRGGRHRMFAGGGDPYFGPFLLHSDDFGRTWTDKERRPVRFPEELGAAVERVWQVMPG